MVVENQQYLHGLERNYWYKARPYSVVILEITTPYKSPESAKAMSVVFFVDSLWKV